MRFRQLFNFSAVALLCAVFAVSFQPYDLVAQSPSSNFGVVIDVPPVSIADNTVIGSNTQVNVTNGGTVGDQVEIGGRLVTTTNTELNVSGGVVGRFLQIYDNATLNVSGGVIDGNGSAESGSTVNISGGRLTGFDAEPGSSVNVSGGRIDGFFSANSQNVNVSGGDFVNFFAEPSGDVDISGGTFLNLTVRQGSVLNLSGGNISGSVNVAQGGATLNISGGSFPSSFSANTFAPSVNIFGSDFLLNGNEISNPESVRVTASDLLTGTLADGSVAIFSPRTSVALVRLQESPLPVIDTNTIVVNGPNDVTPNGLRGGQRLELGDGGILGGNYGVINSELVVNGGLVERGLGLSGSQLEVNSGVIEQDVLATFQSQVNVNNGVLEGRVDIQEGSTLNFAGGLAGQVILADSTANISGGEIDSIVEVLFGSSVNISGGIVGASFSSRSLNVRSGASALVSGGLIRDEINVASGALLEISGGIIREISARSFSDVNLSVLEAFVDGVSITSILSDSEPFQLNERNVNLSGLFADGTQFQFGLSDRFTDFPADGLQRGFFDTNARLSLTLAVPEPTSVPLLLAAVGYAMGRRRKRNAV